MQHTSQLNHPNTITIYDYGRTDEGVFYYAMEYLDGLSLQSLVERFGPQPDGRVIHILLQVCGSLAEAHAQGLIHRDIKPANIMLTERGGVRDYVKLLDFGLVKAIDTRKQTHADRRRLDHRHAAVPAAREHSRYRSGRCPQRSCIRWAEWPTSCSPAIRCSKAAGVMEIIRQHVEGTPVPPSQAPRQAGGSRARRVGAQVPGQVAGQIARKARPRWPTRCGDACRSSPGRRPMPIAGGTGPESRAMDASETATQTIALARTLGQSEFDRSP